MSCLAIGLQLGLLACSNPDECQIRSTLELPEVHRVYLTVEEDTLAESVVVNGKFVLKTNVSEPCQAALVSDNNVFWAIFILEPGARLEVIKYEDTRGKLRYDVSGSKANDEYFKYRQAFSQVWAGRPENASVEDWHNRRKRGIELSRQAIQNNNDNLFGFICLRNNIEDFRPAEALEWLKRFPEYIRNRPDVPKMIARLQDKLRVEPGRPYMDATLPDRDGKMVSISSLLREGKYVLLDFWSSGCKPCMQEVPELLKVYDRFHNEGFEIYGISDDSTRDRWLSAMDKHGMPWINVLCQEREGTVIQDYAVLSLPSTFLIAPDGTIIANNLNSGELEKILEEHLNSEK